MSKRPNGTGNVYKRGNTWTARVVDHYEPADNKAGLKPVWKTKGGFEKKKDAMNYLSDLIEKKRVKHPPKTFLDNFKSWSASYADRVSAKTMEGYASVFNIHFKPLHYTKIDMISAVDLQNCIDNCSKGRRTKDLMKVTAGLVFKYAIDDDQIYKNNAANLYTGDEETTHYEPLTEEELKRISESGLPYADYVVALCYLGHRPTEFFNFKKSDYYTENNVHYIAGGIKTEAGKTRVVTIPVSVQPIVERCLAIDGTDLLFPHIDLDRKGKPTGTYSAMPTRYFNKFIWHPMMDKLGIVGKVPYATRHTYSNKIKKTSGADKDKAELMGHASYETTKKHYQSSTLSDLKAITDQIK